MRESQRVAFRKIKALFNATMAEGESDFLKAMAWMDLLVDGFLEFEDGQTIDSLEWSIGDVCEVMTELFPYVDGKAALEGFWLHEFHSREYDAERTRNQKELIAALRLQPLVRTVR